MLTIFSIPKPFENHIGVIQRNALQSWLLLDPSCEVFLCGNETGIEETAAEFGAKWIPNLDRNEYGTPLLNSAFGQVQQLAQNKLLCYVNADIILLRDFMSLVRNIQLKNFLLVGQRWDIDISFPWDFTHLDYGAQLQKYVADNGKLHPPSGSDYFVFSRDSILAELPPFAVGRPGWDNWFIYNARKHNIAVIDVTDSAMVIHQNHGYNHVSNNLNEAWNGSEADQNRKLAGGWDKIFTLHDATHVMSSNTLLPAWQFKYLQRRLQTLPIFIPLTKPLVRLTNKIENLIRNILR